MDPSVVQKLTQILPDLIRTLEQFIKVMKERVSNVRRRVSNAARTVASKIGRVASRSARGMTAKGMAAGGRTLAYRMGRGLGKIAKVFGKTRIGAVVAGAAARFGATMAAGAAVAGTIGRIPIVGQAILAAGATAAAIAAMGAAAEKATRALLESHRNLARFSPSMAAVFAQSDVRAMYRDMRAGEAQAGSAGFLANAADKLTDAMQPIKDLLSNIGNLLVGFFARVLQPIVSLVAAVAEKLDAALKWVMQKFGIGTGQEVGTISEWLDRVAALQPKQHLGAIHPGAYPGERSPFPPRPGGDPIW